jgi:hypothetical protein
MDLTNASAIVIAGLCHGNTEALLVANSRTTALASLREQVRAPRRMALLLRT